MYYNASVEFDLEEDNYKFKQEMKTHHLRLRNEEEILVDYSKSKNEIYIKRALRRREQGKSRGINHAEFMPMMRKKMEYLMMVEVVDCVKDKVTRCYLAQETKVKT